MKPALTILFFLFFIQNDLTAQNAENRNEMLKVKRLVKDNNLAGFSTEINAILTGITKENLNQKLILIDNIYMVVDGEFSEATDTAVDVFRRNYLSELLKFLSSKQESKFEAAYINFMVGNIKYAIQKQVATSNFESAINKIIPSLSATEKEYVMHLKDKILKLSN